MSVEKLHRALWRLRKNNPGTDTPTYKELEKAVMREIGTHKATYYNTKRALWVLGYCRGYTNSRFKLTNTDLTDS